MVCEEKLIIDNMSRPTRSERNNKKVDITTVFLDSIQMYTVPIVSKSLGLHAIQNLSRRHGSVIVSDYIDSALLVELQTRKLCISEPDGRGLVDDLARKIAVQMAKHGVSVQSPSPIQSLAKLWPQAAHIDMRSSNDQGFACILSIDEATTFDLILKYTDAPLAMRRETIPLMPGHTVMFPGNQPHAGSSYEHSNIRWHYYTPLSPSLSMLQQHTTQMEDR
jgi:hypothetical protein